MKIAFIVNAFPILSETFVLNQITGLLDRGHEVDVYAVHPEKQPVIHGDVEKYRLLDRTFYRGTLPQRMPAAKLPRFTRAVRLFLEHLPHNPLPLLRSLNVLKFGREAASLRLFYTVIPFADNDLGQYDVVHCHFGPNGILASWLKDVGLIRGKVVTTIHGGYDMPMYLIRRGADAYDYLFKTGDLLLPISERWQNELIKLGCEPRKIGVHRMGVDMRRFVFSPRQARNGDSVRVLSVARLVEKKGVTYGIQAVAKVLDEYPNLVYDIAGDGPLRSELEGLIGALGVGDRVRILGWRRQEEIVELMKAADILLAPSVSSEDGDWEGIPVVLMEALAQGLPVLSTQHSGIPELVQDGVSGFLVPERDVDALAEKLLCLLQQPELWPGMGRAGRDFVERYFNIDILNDQLVDLYQGLLDGDSP